MEEQTNNSLEQEIDTEKGTKFVTSKQLIGLGLTLGLFGGIFGTPHLVRNDITATVHKKEIKHHQYSGKNAAKFDYMVHTDQGSFIFEDSFVEWNWDPEGMYKSIEEGETYHFNTYGWEGIFLGGYPAVADYEKIAQEARTNWQE